MILWAPGVYSLSVALQMRGNSRGGLWNLTCLKICHGICQNIFLKIGECKIHKFNRFRARDGERSESDECLRAFQFLQSQECFDVGILSSSLMKVMCYLMAMLNYQTQ